LQSAPDESEDRKYKNPHQYLPQFKNDAVALQRKIDDSASHIQKLDEDAKRLAAEAQKLDTERAPVNQTRDSLLAEQARLTALLTATSASIATTTADLNRITAAREAAEKARAAALSERQRSVAALNQMRLSLEETNDTIAELQLMANNRDKRAQQHR
jgi:hypothetical protein